MKSFRQYNEELAEAVDNWVVTVAKPVNKLKKGAEQKVKARSAFEAINKANYCFCIVRCFSFLFVLNSESVISAMPYFIKHTFDEHLCLLLKHL